MRTYLRWRGALLSVGLAACMGGPPADAVSERRNDAAFYVLTQRAFALALAKQCRIDPEARQDLSSRAQAALESWERRNRARIDAASLYFEDYLAVVARREGFRKGADRRGELTKQHTASGARAAQTSVEQAGGRGGCPDLLEGLGGGEFDIESAEFDPVVEELIARYGASAR
jgi:hypothetical protein